jgi:hypothetical protein
MIKNKSHQKRFVTHVKSLVDTINEMGNPFLDSGKDLLQLDTRDIADEKVIETVRDIEKIGVEQYHSFFEDRLVKKTKAILDPIKKNKLCLFSYQTTKRNKPTNVKQTITSLKKNCSLFSQLYVSCQVHDGDLDDFFRHENQSFPPALSSFEIFVQKTNLIFCIH